MGPAENLSQNHSKFNLIFQKNEILMNKLNKLLWMSKWSKRLKTGKTKGKDMRKIEMKNL